MQAIVCRTPENVRKQHHDPEELEEVMGTLKKRSTVGDDRLIAQAQLLALIVEDDDLLKNLKPETYREEVLIVLRAAALAVRANRDRVRRLLLVSGGSQRLLEEDVEFNVDGQSI